MNIRSNSRILRETIAASTTLVAAALHDTPRLTEIHQSAANYERLIAHNGIKALIHPDHYAGMQQALSAITQLDTPIVPAHLVADAALAPDKIIPGKSAIRKVIYSASEYGDPHSKLLRQLLTADYIHEDDIARIVTANSSRVDAFYDDADTPIRSVTDCGYNSGSLENWYSGVDPSSSSFLMRTRILSAALHAETLSQDEAQALLPPLFAKVRSETHTDDDIARIFAYTAYDETESLALLHDRDYHLLPISDAVLDEDSRGPITMRYYAELDDTMRMSKAKRTREFTALFTCPSTDLTSEQIARMKALWTAGIDSSFSRNWKGADDPEFFGEALTNLMYAESHANHYYSVFQERHALRNSSQTSVANELAALFQRDESTLTPGDRIRMFALAENVDLGTLSVAYPPSIMEPQLILSTLEKIARFPADRYLGLQYSKLHQRIAVSQLSPEARTRELHAVWNTDVSTLDDARLMRFAHLLQYALSDAASSVQAAQKTLPVRVKPGTDISILQKAVNQITIHPKDMYTRQETLMNLIAVQSMLNGVSRGTETAASVLATLREPAILWDSPKVAQLLLEYESLPLVEQQLTIKQLPRAMRSAIVTLLEMDAHDITRSDLIAINQLQAKVLPSAQQQHALSEAIQQNQPVARILQHMVDPPAISRADRLRIGTTPYQVQAGTSTTKMDLEQARADLALLVAPLKTLAQSTQLTSAEQAFVQSTRELVAINIRRLDGKPVRASTTGFGSHPNYAELDEVRNRLSTMIRRGLVTRGFAESTQSAAPVLI